MKKLLIVLNIFVLLTLSACAKGNMMNPEEATAYFEISAKADMYSTSDKNDNKAKLKVVVLPKENTYQFSNATLTLLVKYQAGPALKSCNVKVELNSNGSGALIDKIIDVGALIDANGLEFIITITETSGNMKKK